MQDSRTIGGTSSNFMAARPQSEQADIHQGQADAGDQAGDDRVTGDQARRFDAARANGVNDDDAEHQRTQGVHGQVAIDETLGERRSHIFGRCGTNIARRQSKGGDTQHGQGDDLQRRQEAPHGVEQTAGVQRNEEHHEEVD
ncbi:hypothetical protein D3C85_1243970 [compost metagenome]